MRAEAQLFACLAHDGKRDLLEKWSRQVPPGELGAEYQLQLAAALARQGDADGALAHLRKVLVANPGHARSRMLAYRLTLQRAQEVAREANWQKLSDLIVEAMQFCPEGEDPSSELARYKGALPVSHLRNGKRQESARLWEQQLLENPQDSSVVHNLALLHYWWACDGEQAGDGAAVANHWRPAIIYWSLLAQMDAFWNVWRINRKNVWGFDLTDEELEKLRKRVLDQRFDHDFHNRLDDARQKGLSSIAQEYEECLNSVLLERKSSECWKRALELFSESGMTGLPWKQQAPVKARSVQAKTAPENVPIGLLGLPGGAGFFGKFALVPKIQEAAVRLCLVHGAQECAAHLVILFSPYDIGHAFILAEDRGLPAEALGMLDQLPAAVQASKEALYVRILALRTSAEQLLGRKSFSDAFECWKGAYDKAGRALGANPPAAISRITAVRLPACAFASRGFALEVETDGEAPFLQVIVRQTGGKQWIAKGKEFVQRVPAARFCYRIRVPAEAYNAGMLNLDIEVCKARDIGKASASDWVKEYRELSINPDDGKSHADRLLTASGSWNNEPNVAVDAETLNCLFDPMLASLRVSIQDDVVAAAMKEAKRFKAAEKLDDAIAVLEKARTMDKDGVLLEHLCIHLCERASERIGEKRLNDARKDFARVLELKPGHDRARRGMGTICNNQGCDEENYDKSIALFEKALEWEPDSYNVKMNLARVLLRKAISGVNNASQYETRSAVDVAIRLLERAFKLVNTELKPDALDLIRQISESDSSMANAISRNLSNDVLKQVVENLGIVYHMRARFRRGY
jgi:tetratricopeptide (TPR) repeat protein